MNQVPSYPPVIPTFGTSEWMHDRLTEARGILADVPQHPETLVILACRVVAGQTNDASECADAVEMLSFFERCPLPGVAAAALQDGGVA